MGIYANQRAENQVLVDIHQLWFIKLTET
jgi:hypothetical protein